MCACFSKVCVFFFEGRPQKTSTDDWRPWLLLLTGARHHGTVRIVAARYGSLAYSSKAVPCACHMMLAAPVWQT